MRDGLIGASLGNGTGITDGDGQTVTVGVTYSVSDGQSHFMHADCKDLIECYTTTQRNAVFCPDIVGDVVVIIRGIGGTDVRRVAAIERDGATGCIGLDDGLIGARLSDGASIADSDCQAVGIGCASGVGNS